MTTPTPSPTAAATCEPCRRLGFLRVLAPEVEPPQPGVGDIVTLAFPLDYYSPFSFRCDEYRPCQLTAAPGYLEGDEPGSFSYPERKVIVRRRVLAPGTVSVRLDVTLDTEDQCYYPTVPGQCLMVFTYATIDGSSGDHLIELFEGSPPITPTPTPTATIIPEHCVGDCNGDDSVLVDELVRLVGIALGDDVTACVAGDRDGDQMVTVDEIGATVMSILYGCDGELPDLAAISADVAGCSGMYCDQFGCHQCGGYKFRVCLENHGAAVSQDIAFRLSGRQYSDVLDSLGSGENACVDVPYGIVSFGEQLFEVDPEGAIADSDRTNNVVSFPAPNPTGCDVPCPEATPTPTAVLTPS
jgi:hypothetical protein